MKADRYSHYVEAPIGPCEVKVYDADGKLKRVISSAALSQRASVKNAQGSGRIGPKSGDVYPTVSARKRQTPYHPMRGREGKTTSSEEDGR